MKKFLVSIIIVSYNNQKLLENCFENLALQTFKDYEVILIDNGSADSYYQLVRKLFPLPKLIVNRTNLGFPKACNQGVRLAQGKYLFFLNDDVQMEKSCLEKLVSFMEGKPEAGLAGPVSFSGDKKRLESAGFFPTLSGFFLYSTQILSAQPYQVFGISVAMMVSKALFDKLGGFDPDFFLYSEEVDLCFRIRMIKALEIWLVPEAQIYHLGAQTSKKMAKEVIIFHGTKSRIYLLLKNLSLPVLALILPVHLLLLLIEAFAFLLLGKRDRSLAVIKGVVWNFENLSLVLRKRRGVQAQRLVSDWKIFKNFIKVFPAKRILETASNYLKAW